jgi:hypothetical protein
MENSKKARRLVHIPYRDSKLTRILQDSLGGNTKTYLVATVNPSAECADESISTLRFADRAHQVSIHSFAIIHCFYLMLPFCNNGCLS